ncbi:hypothetical protein BC629DRAFT_17020 [Irpex lacteus]|nr:hypothetical protein BC629DRAFT_17020 [Irpex lacteus]
MALAPSVWTSQTQHRSSKIESNLYGKSRNGSPFSYSHQVTYKSNVHSLSSIDIWPRAHSVLSLRGRTSSLRLTCSANVQTCELVRQTRTGILDRTRSSNRRVRRRTIRYRARCRGGFSVDVQRRGIGDGSLSCRTIIQLIPLALLRFWLMLSRRRDGCCLFDTWDGYEVQCSSGISTSLRVVLSPSLYVGGGP